MRRLLVLVVLVMTACGPNVSPFSGPSFPSSSPSSSTPSETRPTSSTPTPSPSPSKPSQSPPHSGTPSATADPIPQPSSTGGPCSAADLTVTVHTNHSSYAKGAAVGITLSARNKSSHACNAKGNSCTDHVYVDNSGGSMVWSSTPVGRGSCVAPQDHVIAPGASQTYSFSWDQKKSDGTAAPSGSYKAGGTWSVYGNGSDPSVSQASFTIS